MENVDIEILIHLVRLKPYLNDKSHTQYKDLQIKENAWAEIGSALNTNRSTCEKIWKSLKDKFCRERKKIKNVPSGSGSTPIKTWTWYDDFKFLDSTIQERRKTMSNLNNVSMPLATCSEMNETFLSEQEQSTNAFDGDHDNDFLDFDNQDSIDVASETSDLVQESTILRDKAPATTHRVGKRKANNDVDSAIIHTLKQINKQTQNFDDSEQAFGQLVAVELAKIKDTDKRREINGKIMNIFYSQ